MARARLSFRRAVGLDRSVSPVESGRGQPLRPFTIPNAIGFARLLMIPLFVVFAWRSPDGRATDAAIVYAACAWADYLDGLTARLTGQYSRLGALLDPVVDRLLVLSGVVVTWHFDLLPHWLLAILGAREVAMLVLSQLALRRGGEIKINWVGRWAVWPTMAAIFFAMVLESSLGAWLLGVGVAMSVAATFLYVRSELSRMNAPSTSS